MTSSSPPLRSGSSCSSSRAGCGVPAASVVTAGGGVVTRREPNNRFAGCLRAPPGRAASCSRELGSQRAGRPDRIPWEGISWLLAPRPPLLAGGRTHSPRHPPRRPHLVAWATAHTASELAAKASGQRAEAGAPEEGWGRQSHCTAGETRLEGLGVAAQPPGL